MAGTRISARLQPVAAALAAAPGADYMSRPPPASASASGSSSSSSRSPSSRAARPTAREAVPATAAAEATTTTETTINTNTTVDSHISDSAKAPRLRTTQTTAATPTADPVPGKTRSTRKSTAAASSSQATAISLDPALTPSQDGVKESVPARTTTKRTTRHLASRRTPSSYPAKRQKQVHRRDHHLDHQFSLKQKDTGLTATPEPVLPTPPSQSSPTPQECTLDQREEEAFNEQLTLASLEQELEEEGLSQPPRFLGHRPTNPLELHEIRINVARFLSRSDLRSCLMVSEGWWESFAPFLWADMRPVYRNILGGTNDYPAPKLMRKNGHLIKTFEYNGHGSVLLSMIPCERLYDNSYVDDEIEWRKTDEEELAEANWMYVDEDIETSEDDGRMVELLNPDETLSEFEDRLETKRVKREERLVQLMDAKVANRRQNEVSRFLNDTMDYRQRVCDQIEKIIFTEKRYSRDRGCYYKNWIKLMQLNQGHLRSLEFHFAIRAFDAYRDIFSQIVSLERLSELTLVDNDLDVGKVKPFLETVCVRLSKLELRNVRIEYGAFPGQAGQSPAEHEILPMDKMKSLTLIKVHARNSTFALQFLRNCPNLVELAFRPQWGLSVKDFTATVTEKLSKVTHLTFRTPGMSDMDAASIIKAVPVVQKLDFSGSTFGLMATNHLSTRHHFTVSYVDIRTCTNVTGSMIQRILGECRNLRYFMADHIRAKDAVNNSVYPTWACIGLRELTLDIRGDSTDMETNFKIYQQLGRLTCLEFLDVSKAPATNSSYPITFEAYSNALTLGLKFGLKELRTLVHLNKLIYRGAVNNEVGVAELLWMAKAWPQLTQIGGKLKQRKSTRFNPNVHPKEEIKEQDEEAEDDDVHMESIASDTDDSMSMNGIQSRSHINRHASTVGRSTRATARSNARNISGSSSNTHADSTMTEANDATSTTATVASSSAPSSLASSIASTTSATYSLTDIIENINSVNPTGTAAAAAALRLSSTLSQLSARPPPAASSSMSAIRMMKKPPPNLMAIELRRLRLNHRIKVIHHQEDKVTPEQRRRHKYLLGESSDEEPERLRPGQTDPRYRNDVREWM